MGWTFYNSSGEQLIYDAGSAIEQATQAEAEAESNVNKYIPPDLIKNSPGVAKAWGVTSSGGTIESGSYNVNTYTKTSTGNYRATFVTSMSNALYSAFSAALMDDHLSQPYLRQTGQLDITVRNNSHGSDDEGNCFVVFGDL